MAHALPLTPMLAQAVADAAAATKPWWQILLENGLPLTILFIFLAAIIGVVVKVRRKDKCLKLLHDHHVSYLTTAGAAIWGDLVVYSLGLELRFDAPHTTRRGLTKSSALVYEPELASCLAICRVDAALTEDERRKRQRQVRRTFRPGIIRRALRGCRNLVNTLRDAFSKALAAVIGQLARARPGAGVVGSQQTQVNEIGQTLLGAAANAYEPLLEAHIGKPVILRLTPQAGPAQPPTELPGYLVDYTDKYLAVFNTDHQPIERLELELTEDFEQPGFRIELGDREVTVRCVGPAAVVLHEAESGGARRQYAVPLLPGCAVSAPRDGAGLVRLVLERTWRLDVVCPRSIAAVYFAADDQVAARPGWLGQAPRHHAEEAEPAASA